MDQQTSPTWDQRAQGTESADEAPPAGAAAARGPKAIRSVTTVPLNPWPTPDDWADIKELVVGYLSGATAILAARGRGDDALDPSATFVVPLMQHTDGTFTWPAAAAYYAVKHDIAPAPELLAHMRAEGFQVPEVSKETAAKALGSVRDPRL